MEVPDGVDCDCSVLDESYTYGGSLTLFLDPKSRLYRALPDKQATKKKYILTMASPKVIKIDETYHVEG